MNALKNFRTLELSISFYKECKQVKLSHAMKDQLMRAASSIALNLSEGSSRPSTKERLRYYSIAFGSIREIQTIIKLEGVTTLEAKADHLAASLYKLTHQ